MNKKIVIGALIFLAIAVIGVGIYYFGINQRADNGNKATGESGGNALPQVKKLDCEDVADAKEKENCQVGVVKLLNSESSSACESLAAEADKSICRQSYIIKEAVSSGNLNKCSEITDKVLAVDCSAQASFSLAIQKKDKKYCERIINKADKENCFKVLADLGVK